MTEKHFKLIQWMLYGLMAISALFGLLFYINPSSSDLLIYWGYILAVVSGVVTILLSIVSMARNPKGSIKVLVIIAAMIIVGVISYAMSTNTYSAAELDKYDVTASGVKLVSAGLYMTYVIAIIAIAVFIYSSVSRIFNK